jgi:SnoaL-like protein
MEWERGWRDHDVERIDALYADACVFRSAPFRATQVPREFVEWAFSDEESAEVRFGDPIVEGERAAVEWNAVSTLKSGEVERLAGVSVLRFDADGLVVEECGYWQSER